MRSEEELWDFPVMDGVSFSAANRVHPLMQKRIQAILEALCPDSNLRRLVLYGSSLEFGCGSRSDIDLLAETHDTGQSLPALPDVGCDIDMVRDIPHSSRLYNEIDRTGLILYERDAGHV